MSDARVYTVNALLEQISGQFIAFALPRDEIGRVYRAHGFADRVVQIYANTWDLDVTSHVPPGSIYLAIIDACHDPEFVVNDFLCVLPALHETAIVLFHDTHPSMGKHLRGSYIACMYLRKLGYDVRHIAHTWWGVWQRGRAMRRWSPAARTANTVDNWLVRLRGKDPRQDARIMQWLSRRYQP